MYRPQIKYICLALLATPTSALAQTNVTLLPSDVHLQGRRASQSLLVELTETKGFVGDGTAQSTFTSDNPRVATVEKSGLVRPVANGKCMVTAKLSGRTVTATITVSGIERNDPPSFRNHILPILTRAGCNGGSCHGAAAGKGGLKLTLRGFDPAADYAVLTHQARGRRVTPGSPEQSLMLQKAAMMIGHGGGERIKKNSSDYKLIADWIRAGAPRPQETDVTVSRLEVFPPLVTLKRGGEQRFVVRAVYSDGHAEDVTRWVKFGSSAGQIATVDEKGATKVGASGEAAVTAWFSSKVAFARVVSPYPNPTMVSIPKNGNPIDDLVGSKLERLQLPASPLCSDAEFLRRSSLDAAGILPTPAEVRTFLADKRLDKRAQIIDSLIEREEFIDTWTYKWSDLLMVSSRKLSGPALTGFYNWIRDSVKSNKPWDKFARELITATGSNLDNGAANFYLLHKEPIDLTETTTQAFLGMSVQCAHCHNHPMEKWTQNDYYQMANLFARVRLKNGDRAGEVLALVTTDGDIHHPRLARPLPPRPLDGKEVPLTYTGDRRVALADWLTASENPYFARALVNRVWRHFMGRGLVEAEDDLRLTNPPSNPELMDSLSSEFIKNGFNVKALIRMIMNSQTYQRSSIPVGGMGVARSNTVTSVSPDKQGVEGSNAVDDRYGSHYVVKRLSSEALLDAVSQVTGVPTDFPGYGKGTRAAQLRDSQVASYFLTAFGRPERAQTCSCERQQEPSVAQALHLVNGDTINQKLRAPGGIIDQLLKSKSSDSEVVEELFLRALSRLPNPSEKHRLVGLLKGGASTVVLKDDAARALDRRAAIEDLFWAVLSDREFLFNH